MAFNLQTAGRVKTVDLFKLAIKLMAETKLNEKIDTTVISVRVI